MKTRFFLILGLLAAFVCPAQDDQPATYGEGWFMLTNSTSRTIADGNEEQASVAIPQVPGGGSALAEAITPDISDLARGLKNDPKRIFDFVHDHIRYVHYFGSHKGAELTLLERSGNDFDQCALLMALLTSAGFSANYQFGTVSFPYATANHQDYQHWVTTTMPNTNWDTTMAFVDHINAQGCFPFTAYLNGDTNDVVFHHVWVSLSWNGTNYTLDPSFKVSEPVAGINLDDAMGLSANDILDSAAGTGTADYVQGLNEAALRATLQGYNGNLLSYLQTDCANASVEQITGGQQIVSSAPCALGQAPLAFTIQTDGGSWPTSQWRYIPKNLMAVLSVTLASAKSSFYTPALRGDRLSLTFDSTGVAQLWRQDTQQFSITTSGSGQVNVTLAIQHPFGTWNFKKTNNLVRQNLADQSLTKGYQCANANYILLYGFDPAPAWLNKRQQQLDAYLKEGYAKGSRRVKIETLNVMGLNWLAQTELDDRMVAAQEGVLIHWLHRLGRVAQESGHGYYVDVYGQLGTHVSAVGDNDAAVQAANQVFQVNMYLDSALEHGMIEQLQATNLVAASTVKILELASANSQTIYLATSNNWTAGADVSGHLTNYNKTTLYNNYISQGDTMLLPANGSVPVAGSGSWTGTGYVVVQFQGNFIPFMSMYISGGYNGGYVSLSTATPDPGVIVGIDQNGSAYFDPQSAVGALPAPVAADPVNMSDGTFRISSTDLALGQKEPRGLSLTRYYSSSRRNSDVAGMADGWVHSYNCNAANIAAPFPGLGLTTPRQMTPMLVAIRAALNVYNGNQPDPKNWVVTALIAKWGIDQLVKNGVSVNLGKDTIQFIEQPDGAYTPPANCTMTMTGTNGAYVLQERHGRTFNFGSNNLLANIVDQYGNPMNFTYNSSNWVSTVTDWKGRELSFTYSGAPSHLTSISEGARAVSYGYTANAQKQLDLTSVTDPDGNTSYYTYDTNHQIITTKNANNQVVVSNVYDGYGRVLTQYTGGNTNQTWQVYWSPWEASADDPMGGEQNFFFDDQSRQIGCQDALGNLTQTAYDGQDHVIMTVSPLNETNLFFYDGSNDLLYAVDALGFTNTSVFDSQNNLIETIDPLGHARHFGYNAQFSLIGQTNGAGDWLAYTYNNDGTLASRQDSAGATSYGYDIYGQVNSITYPGGLGGESFVNDAYGDPILHTDRNGNQTAFFYNNRRQLFNTVAPTNIATQIIYDSIGNVFRTTDARNSSTTYAWSATRHLLATILPATPQGVPIVTNTYDARDWFLSSQNPLQKTTYFINDAAHRLIACLYPPQRITVFTYDNDSRQLTATFIYGQTTQTWNARGNLVQVVDAATNTVGRAYDGNGNLIYLTNRNNNVWQFQYDAANRLINTISPKGYSTSQGYNNRGLLAAVTNALTHITTCGYDARARLTNRTDSVGTTFYQYDPDNNLINASENGRSLQGHYDAYNRMSSYTDVNGFQIQYKHDANGNLTNLVYPGNRTVNYYYDSLNRLTNVTDWASRQTVYSYDLAGHLTSVTRPNKTLRLMSYDDGGELTNIVERATSQFPIAFYKLNYDLAGRVQWEFKGPLPHTNTAPTRTMTYDADNRLATFNGTSVTVDNAGNLTYGPGTNNTFGTYTYDPRNELTSAGGLSYGYDPAGNRTSLTNGANAATYVIDPGSSQVLMRINGGVTNYYIYGAGLAYEIDETATTTTVLNYHPDIRGSTIALTDVNGNLTDQFEYSPYGMTTYHAGTNTTPFLYNGQWGVQTDPNGLLHMRARYYNPYICRFINADPSGFGGGLNFYLYANGNPVSELDPFGLGAVGENGSEPSMLDQFKEAWGLPTGVAGEQQGEQAAANVLNAATFGLANPIAGVLTGQDLFGNTMDQGEAVEQLLEVAAVDSSLFLAVATEGFSAEAEGAAGGYVGTSATEGAATESTALVP